jgi:hypothetical protein
MGALARDPAVAGFQAPGAGKGDPGFIAVGAPNANVKFFHGK